MFEIFFAEKLVNAVSDKTRSGIIESLARRECTLADLSERTGLVGELLISQIGVLEEAGLAVCRKMDDGVVWGINPRMRVIVGNYLQNAENGIGE